MTIPFNLQFSPDLPDFTTENSAGIVNIEEVLITPGTSHVFGLSGVASYSVLLQAVDPGPVLAAFLSQANPVITSFLNLVVFTAMEDPVTAGATYMIEIPSYGGVVTVINQSAGGDLLVLVNSSNRLVSAPNINQDYAQIPPFSASGPFVAGTAQYLSGGGVGGPNYVANVEAGLTVKASGAGLLEYWFIDFDGNVWHQPVADLAAGVRQYVTVALPWGVGGWYFTPTGSDAVGTIDLFVQPARN